MSGEAEDTEDLDADADESDEAIGKALDVLQGLLQLTQSMDGTQLDLQGLQLPPRSAAEKALAKYAWVGKAAVGAVAHATAALPFGAPVAAVLNGAFGRAEQVRPA